MQCPNCALYHPARYEVCVSCATKLVGDGDLVEKSSTATPSPPGSSVRQPTASAAGNKAPFAGGYGGTGARHNVVDSSSADGDQNDKAAPPLGAAAWLSNVLTDVKTKWANRGTLPLGLGITIAAFILCASGGVTFFFLTKPPEDQRLLQQGQKELRDGQYAFALKTLTQAAKGKPDDPRILLSLARAYVGVDQVDKAWLCITQAQQLGAGVVAEPQLASDLANYYRQRNQYQRAVELLRPLAASNIPGKKAELADLDGLWGDDCLRDGDYLQALKCWEEVRDMHEGSRYMEADGRLSSIYQRIADNMIMKGDSEEALKYLSRLNVLTPSAAAYEKTAEIYQKQGQLELAIDQLRKATKLSGGDASTFNHKIATLMVARGKELLDRGDSDAGYGYLQQAQALDPRAKAPTTTVRNVRMEVEPGTGFVHASGEVWNPGPAVLQALSLKGELFDSKSGAVIWTKEQHVVDEFVPPLNPRESRNFDMTSGVVAGDPAATQFRIYLNGILYKAYSLSGKALNDVGGTGVTSKGSSSGWVRTGNAGDINGGAAAGNGGVSGGAKLRPPIGTSTGTGAGNSGSGAGGTGAGTGNPPVAPNFGKQDGSSWLPSVAPNAVPNTGPSAEEKTLKDLE